MDKPTFSSPKWNSTTKLVVGLTLVAIVSALLIQFREIIGPLILAFMLAYILFPLVSSLSDRAHLSWRLSVNLVYLVLVVLVIAILTLAGFAITQQLQSLIKFVQDNVNNIPIWVDNLSKASYKLGPFKLSLAQFELQSITDRLLSMVQNFLSRAGGIISTFAASAAVTVGWSLFMLVVSYFLLSDTRRVSDELVHIELPGYDLDIRRLGRELANIWNAFLRGQLTIIGMVIIIYTFVMMVLGIRFAFGIAILAGLGRFVPYLGPATVLIVTSLVAFFQGGNYFGLQPLHYVILVIAAAIIIDQTFDNLVAPRIMGKSLGVHPAALLVAAIIAANLIGIIGLVLAAPVLATLNLVARYTIRKLFDIDPWPSGEAIIRPVELPWSRLFQRVKSSWNSIWRRNNPKIG